MKNADVPPQALPDAALDGKTILAISFLSGSLGGLCCLTPIVLVLLGLANVSVAASLGNVLYGDYRWVFRILGLLFLGGFLVVYFRKRGVCTLDEAKRQRVWLLNIALLMLLASATAYIFWTYVVLQYGGIAAGLPWAQYDESWATPASIVLALVSGLWFIFVKRKTKSGPHQDPGA